MKTIFEFVTSIFAHPWACCAETIERLMVALHESHSRSEFESSMAKAGVNAKDPGRLYGTVRNGSTAVVKISGVMVRESLDAYPAWIRNYFTSTLDTERAIGAALADDSISHILLDVDSPGGSVYGIDELANFIRGAAAQKPITTYTGGMMASAAYYVGSAAPRVIIGSGAEVGSIGVYAILQDWSKFWSDKGIKTEMIKAGEFKGEGHPDLPITDKTRKVTQEIVDAYYEQFVAAVAKNRNLSQSQARELADGRTHIGAAAVAIGLVDSVGSFNEAAAGTRASSPLEQTQAALTTPENIAAQPCGGANSVRAGHSATQAVSIRASRLAGVGQGRLMGQSRVQPAEREDSKMSTNQAGQTAEVLAADIKVSEATFQDVRDGNPRVFKQISDAALRDEQGRVSGIANALKETALPSDIEGKVAAAVANMSVEDAKKVIACAAALEGALQAGRLNGLDDEDIKALRADVEGLGQLAAVRMIARAVDAKKGMQERLAKVQDLAVAGEDAEKPEDKAKAERAASVKAIRSEFAKVAGFAGIQERSFVEQRLAEQKVSVPAEELDELLK